MPKILEKQALVADLAAVKSLLDFKSQSDDPIGRMAYQERAQFLEDQIASLDVQPDKLASVALLFGGEPVHGSRSISADFATDALGKFQDLVSKLHADKIEAEGLPNMGKIPHKGLSTLQITDVAHGSFGFLLEERDTDQAAMFDTPLKETLDEAVALIASFYSENEDEYIGAIDAINTRIFSSLRDFFKVLFDARATVRVVEGSRDDQLDRPEIEKAYDRSQRTKVDETEMTLDGILIGIIPTKMEFEFQPDMQDEPIVGKTGPAISRSYLDKIHAQQQVVGSHCQAKILLKTTVYAMGKTTKKYTMLDLIIP
jgi:hypothetical protein